MHAVAPASGVRAFDRRAFVRSNYRQAIRRAVVIGFGTVSAASLMGGAVTAAAIWIIAGALGAAPHLNTRTPMAPASVPLAEAYGKFAEAAKDSGLMRGFTRTVRVAETALSSKLMSAEILTAGLIRAPQPAEAPALAQAEAAPSAASSSAVSAAPRSIEAPLAPAQRVATVEPPSVWSSIFSKIFGRRSPSAEPSVSVMAPPEADSHTAIYDIVAHTVYLPSGERLEAHSGLGERIDDPRYVRERARGPTPPNVYNLTLRESLFHGVRALRLNPINDSKMYGRDGILAHTYMLGPSGQSNGCVSFRDYQQFLKAYLRGEINRLVVVPHLETRTSSTERTRS